MTPAHSHHQLAAALIAALALAACDGFGSSPTTPTPAPLWQTDGSAERPEICAALPDDADFVEACATLLDTEDSHVVNQQSLWRMNMHWAYARGATGEGIWVASNEEGQFSYPGPGYLANSRAVFIGGSDPGYFRRDREIIRGLDGESRTDTTFARMADGKLNTSGHPSTVLQLMVGARTGSGLTALQGVAYKGEFVAGVDVFDADHLLLMQRLGVVGVDVGGVQVHYAFQVQADGSNDFLEVDGFINYSNQFSGDDPEPLMEASARRYLSSRPDLWQQDDVDEADRVIFVVPAGNEGFETSTDRNFFMNPLALATLPSIARWKSVDEDGNPLPTNVAEAEDLEKITLTAVALGSGRQPTLTRYSSWCGIAADYCLAIPVSGTLVHPGWQPQFTDASASQLYLGANEDVAGTSVAAPLLVGALALLRSHFPTLGNVEVAERIKATASRDGLGISNGFSPDGGTTYLFEVPTDEAERAELKRQQVGLGRPDLKAATEPMGDSMIALGGSGIDSLGIALRHSGLRLLSPAFGDALAAGFSRPVMALDELKAPFYYAMPALIRQQPQLPLADRQFYAAEREELGVFRLRLHRATDGGGGLLALGFGPDAEALRLNFGSGISPALLAGPTEALGMSAVQGGSAFGAPWANAERAWRAAGVDWRLGRQQFRWLQFHSAGQEPNGQGAIAETSPPTAAQARMLAWQMGLGPDTRLGLHLVDSLGSGELLGLTASGGLGQLLQTEVAASGAWARQELGHSTALLFSLWQINGRADTGAGALRSARGLRADSWALALAARAGGGARLLFRLEQPIRMRRGWLEFQLPTSRTRYREILYSTERVGATPSGRELRVQLDYEQPLSRRGGLFSLSLGRAAEPGHSRNAAPALYAHLGLSLPL